MRRWSPWRSHRVNEPGELAHHRGRGNAPEKPSEQRGAVPRAEQDERRCVEPCEHEQRVGLPLEEPPGCCHRRR